MKFILNSGAWEERSARGHLIENASNAPHINGGGILCRAQKDVWRSVPEGDNFVTICLGWNTFCTCKSKICQLKENFVNCGTNSALQVFHYIHIQ